MTCDCGYEMTDYGSPELFCPDCRRWFKVSAAGTWAGWVDEPAPEKEYEAALLAAEDHAS